MTSVSITFELPAFLNFDLVHSEFHLPVILFHKEAQQPVQSSTLTRYQSMPCSWRLQQDTRHRACVGGLFPCLLLCNLADCNIQKNMLKVESFGSTDSLTCFTLCSINWSLVF